MKKSFLKPFVPESIKCLRKGYSFDALKSDLLAGLNVGVLAFPLALACAIGANISPERGLFTAIIAGFMISALGGSRILIGGPTSAFIVVLYGIMMRHGFECMVMTTLLAGVILILFGLAGFGAYIKYIPYPVVTALTTGIAVVVFSSQIKDFFGLSMGSVPIDFVDKWGAYGRAFSTWNLSAVLIGLATLGVILYLRRKRPRIPGSLIALAGVTFIVWLFNIDVPTIGSRFGELPRSLPTPSIPLVGFEKILELIPDALTLAILGGMETLLASVVAEGMTGWRSQSNCELIAQGVGNIGSALFGGMPATGSFARTAANVKSGARTPIAGMVHAVVIFLIMFLLAPLASCVPLAALAAVLFILAYNMSQLRHFFHLFTAPKKDVIVLITVFTLTVLVNITVAVQVGMILAALLFMKQMSDMSNVVETSPTFEDAPPPQADPDALSKKDVPYGVEVFEINGPFFFGVADRLKNVFNQLDRPPKVFILRMRKVPAIDASGMHALEEFFIECRRQGTQLLLSGVNKKPLKDLQRYHLDELIGEDHVFSHVNSALEFSRELLRVETFKRAMQ